MNSTRYDNLVDPPININIDSPSLFFMLHTNIIVGVGGKREAHKKWSSVIPKKAAPVTRTTLRTTGPVPADSRH